MQSNTTSIDRTSSTGPALHTVPGDRAHDHGSGQSTTPGPLTGWTAEYADRRPALDIVLRHLSCLGASVRRQPGARPGNGTGTAFHLAGPEAAGVPDLSCRIDWACRQGAGIPDETAAQAATGLMAVHGRRRGAPARIPVDYATACAGVLAVQGVLASLVARARGTAVTFTGTSVTHAALVAVSQYLAAATADDEEPLPRDTPEAGPPFRSRDGVWFEVEALTPEPWRDFWSALGVPADDIRRGWQPFVLRYPTAVCPLPAALAAAVAARSFASVTEVAARTGMSVCRIRTLDERRGDPGLLAGGRVAAPWTFTSFPLAAQPPAAAAPPPHPDRPLEGLTVVEAGRRIQAPMATHVLHLLGARVVRIEPPEGDPLRGIPPMVGDCSARFVALNKGKEVLHADLRSAAGRAAVLDAARGADAFLHNLAPGKAAALGLDAGDLLAVNPRLVYAYSSGWGEALGPNPPLGTDFMTQAHSGLAALMADGEDGGQPRPSLMTLLDVLGGLVAAEGLLAGLLQREHSGRGLRVDTSLLSASTVLQYEALERPAGPRARGCGTVDAPRVEGPWRTSDGWLALSARSLTSVGRLCRLLGVDPAASEETLCELLEDAFAGRPAEQWRQDLAAAGVTATVVATDLRRLVREPVARHALAAEECTLVTAPWRFEA